MSNVSSWVYQVAGRLSRLFHLHRKRCWKIKELAKRAKTSPATVLRALDYLRVTRGANIRYSLDRKCWHPVLVDGGYADWENITFGCAEEAGMMKWEEAWISAILADTSPEARHCAQAPNPRKVRALKRRLMDERSYTY